MAPPRSIFLLAAMFLATTSATRAQSDTTRVGLELHEQPVAGSETPLRTGVFRVWENRETRTGRVLELDVVVLPATGATPRPDPLFFIAGGPGQAAATLHRRYIDHWIREKRDIVLVSQRGTGGSNRLSCDLPGGDDELQAYLGPIFDPEVFRKCLADLSTRADLRLYSTPIAMDDLNDLRLALGYDRINLMGGSYGTRAALIYLRRHPETVRTVVLNGVAPVSFVNPLFHAREAQRALDLIAERCSTDPACHAAFPDPAAELQAVLARLDDTPARVDLAHPETGAAVTLTLTRSAFAEALRVLMYFDSSDIPLLIHSAFEGDYATFAEIAVASNRGLRTQIAFGMLLCVTCAEDVDRIDPDLIPALTKGTFLGDERVRQQVAVCEIWPRSEIPSSYAQPVRADVPVLLLSGILDPVTPPRWGAQAASHLPRSLHLTVPGSHGVGGPCIDGIIEQFLDTGTLENLDTSCVESMQFGPFTLPDRH